MEIIEEGRCESGAYCITIECNDTRMSEILGCTPLNDPGRLHPLSYQEAFRHVRNPRPGTDDAAFEVLLQSGAKLQVLTSQGGTFLITAEDKDSAYLVANAALAELNFLEAINKARVSLNRQYALMGYVTKPELMVSINMERAAKKAPGQV